MNIGIYIDAKPSSGGIYQYTYNIVDALKKYDKKNEYTLFISQEDRIWETFSADKWELVYLKKLQGAAVNNAVAKGISQIKGKGALKTALVGALSGCKQYVMRNVLFKSSFDKIDLMVFPSPSTFSYRANIPFVAAIHDLQHRLQPEFPEVSKDGEWEKREVLFGNIARKALLILVDSEAGKEDVVNIYGAPQEKIKVLPFLPPTYLANSNRQKESIDIRQKYNLPEKYIFYPAQFWPHKNHLRLVRAVHLLKTRRNIEVSVVLAGSPQVDYSTLDEVMKLSEELETDKQIKYLGYVPHEDMAALYSNASALVMPTFFGPTNIPILEAFALSCPVITSDIRGIREQVGDAGLLADPESVEAIAEAIYKIYTKPELSRELVERGLKKASEWTESDFARQVLSIIENCEAGLKKTK